MQPVGGADAAHDSCTRMNAEARAKFGQALAHLQGIEFFERLLHRERRAACLFGMPVIADRGIPHGEDRIPEELDDRAVVPVHRHIEEIEISDSMITTSSGEYCSLMRGEIVDVGEQRRNILPGRRPARESPDSIPLRTSSFGT